MEEFQELKNLVLYYLRGIWRYRWIAILVAWPVMIAGIAVVDRLEDRYVAETKVYLDSSSILRPLLEGLAIQTDFSAIVQLMVRKLLSRPNLERAVRSMNMDHDVKTSEEMEGLILSVRERIEVKGDERTGTYQITYTDTDRDTAKRMVETLLDIFIYDTLGKSTDESDSAIAFLDQQIQKYDRLLQEAENRREEFKRKNLGLMPQDGANYYGQLQQVDAELEKIVISLNESISRRDQLRFKLLELAESNKAEGEEGKSSFDQKIIDQEARLNDLLLLYTDAHPDVINARKVLEVLKQRREQELATLKPVVKPTLDNNKVNQEIQILLAKIESDISSLGSRRQSFEKKKRELNKLVEIMPKIEAELQRLNRDYDVHKSNYTELVQRREKARISEEAEEGTEQIKFRIIEPPFVPLKPKFPNRVLLDLGVLIAAIGVGYGLSLLISLFRPVFSSPMELRRNLDYPLLGTVKKFDTADVVFTRRRNLALFITANLLLVFTSVALAYLHSKEMAILSNMKSIVT